MKKYFISLTVTCVSASWSADPEACRAGQGLVNKERIVTEFLILSQHFRADPEGNLHLQSQTPGPGPVGMPPRGATSCLQTFVSHVVTWPLSIADNESSARSPLLWHPRCSVIGAIYRPPEHNQTASEGGRNPPDLIINLKCGIVFTRTNGLTQLGIKVITIN